MMHVNKTVQYTTKQERATIIQQNEHLFLIGEQNIIDGNFLIFSDAPLEPLPAPKIFISIPEEVLEKLKSENESLKQSQAEQDDAIFELANIIGEMMG